MSLLSKSAGILAMLLMLAAPSAAQAEDKPGGAAAAAADGCTGATPTPELRLGDWISLTVPADKWAHFAATEGKPAVAPVLYVNDLPVDGLQWKMGGCRKIAFLLLRTEDSREIWGRLLARLDGTSAMLGLGTKQQGFITNVGTAKMILLEPSMYKGWIVFIGVLCLVVVVLGQRSRLLRDFWQPPAEDPAAPPARPTRQQLPSYSLGRVQMAWWFVLVIGAFSYIFIVTGDLSAIPGTLLALIGISATTTVVSAVIDTGESGPARTFGPSRDFLTDILSDDDGIGLHRLQMVAWTVLLGVIFITNVVKTLALPDIDAQLLGLMGVTSATYLGFKIPAAKPAAAA